VAAGSTAVPLSIIMATLPHSAYARKAERAVCQGDCTSSSLTSVTSR